MSLSRVITEIWWEPSQGFDPRAATVFSDAAKIRLDPADFKLKLRAQSDFRYPTDADLSARSRTYRPEAVRRLLMIQLNATLPTDEDGAAVASVGLRLFDGTDERFWDGAAWAVASPGEWNTEAEVNGNIDQFDASSRAFAVVFNLRTTDDRVTPEVESAFLLWEGEVDWSQDIILDSLTATVKENAVWTEDVALPPLEADSAVIDLDDYVDDSNLTVVGMDAVYDHTADPTHRTDLLQSYDVGAREITLAVSIPAGSVPYLRMRCQATVAWDTQQDFAVVAHLPEVILGQTETVNSSPYPTGFASGIVRKDTGAAVKVPAPYRMTYKVSMEVRTDRSREQQRLLDALLTLFTDGPTGEEGPFLRSRATDRRYRLWLIEEFRAVAPNLNLSDVRTFQAEFRIEDVALNLRSAVDTFAVRSLKMGFSAVSSTEEQRALTDGAPVRSGAAETIEVTQ